MKNLLLATGLCAGLAACGGSGSGITSVPGGGTSPGTTSASPGGFYSGTLTNSFGGSTDSIIGIFTENGDGVFIDQTSPAIYRLTANVNANSLSATFRGYAGSGYVFANNSSTESGTVSGTVTERSSIRGTYYGPNNTSGTVTLTYQGTQYAVPTSLTALVGTYQFSISTSAGNDTVTFSINSSGQVIGSTVSGCNINGMISIPNPQFDAQQFRFTSTCSGSTASYTGVSTYTPATANARASLTLEYDNGSSSAIAVTAGKQ